MTSQLTAVTASITLPWYSFLCGNMCKISAPVSKLDNLESDFDNCRSFENLMYSSDHAALIGQQTGGVTELAHGMLYKPPSTS